MTRFAPPIAPHLDYAALTQRTQDCQDPLEKQRWLAIRLLSQPDAPMTTQQVATALHYSADWVRKQVQRYNRLGADGLVHGRQRRQRRDRSRWLAPDRLASPYRL